MVKEKLQGSSLSHPPLLALLGMPQVPGLVMGTQLPSPSMPLTNGSRLTQCRNNFRPSYLTA